MFEDFTDRTRKVMNLAVDEARKFNHEHIGTEHLLLGLLYEGSGIGATVLKNCDINCSQLKKGIEKLIKKGPDQVTVGRLPQTPAVKRVIEYAIEFARELNHESVGTEHILYGLMQDPEMISWQVLIDQGLTQEKIKKEIEELLGLNVKEEYWKVPRDKRNLDEFLKFMGYNFRFMEDTLEIDVKRGLSEVSYIKVGECNKEESIIDLKITYDFKDEDSANSENLMQVGFALDLKELLDVNGISYTEEPDSKEVLEILNKPGKERQSVINRLEKILGKQK